MEANEDAIINSVKNRGTIVNDKSTGDGKDTPHDLKSYRNACRIVKQLSPYIHETMYEREKVIYLNKDGRELIGSAKEVKRNSLMGHTLLANEAYLYFNCPIDWQTEYSIEVKEAVPTFGIQFKGIKQLIKRKSQ